MSKQLKSRKCEHGMMPWECSDCTPNETSPEYVIAGCIEAVSNLFISPEVSYSDVIDSLKAEAKKYE